ncbi:MAG: hypothetical protein WKF43_09070 [Acidimicrobiales bacterium]
MRTDEARDPMKLSAYGITTELPAGWEGRITKRTTPSRAEGRAPPGLEAAPARYPTRWCTSPASRCEQRGDFGSGAVDAMGAGDLLVILFEYGPESVGQALFARPGMPSLRPAMFSPSSLQRTLTGQAGCQRWFTESGRPFCAYVVLGRHAEAQTLVPLANATLRATEISPR